MKSYEVFNKVNESKKFIERNWKLLVRVIAIVIFLIASYVISVKIHNSTELYMLSNYGEMKKFAELHRDYVTSADREAKEQAVQDFIVGLD